MTKTEAYRVFGLSMNQPITQDLVKERYRILTKTYHPDNPRTGSEEMMAKVNIAHDALLNYRFDPEGSQREEAPTPDRDFPEDFNPDFTPFEFGSRDESFYENHDYVNREETDDSGYYDAYGTYDESDDFGDREYDSETYAGGQEAQENWETSDEYQETYEEDWEDSGRFARSDERDPREGSRSTRERQSRSNGSHGRKGRKKLPLPLRLLAGLFKVLVILGMIGLVAAAPVMVYLIGLNVRGIVMAAACLVMAGLSVLVYKFFGELIS